MEEYIFNLINYVSLETIIISFIIFIFTMLIKIPIKKLTSKLGETKRKAINSIIILIPIILSIIINVLYFILFKPINLIYNTLNSWLISLSIYAIYERLKLIIKAFLEGKADNNLIESTNKSIKEDLSELLITIKNNEKLLEKTKNQLSNLNKIKINIETNTKTLDLSKLFKTNLEIQTLTTKEKDLENEINELKNQLKIKEENKTNDI